MRVSSLETKGSTDIDVKVNQQIGYTYFAGLYFLDSTRISVSDNGAVQVDRAGLRAKANAGAFKTLNAQFEVPPGASLTLTKNFEYELRDAKGDKVVGPALLLDHSGSPSMGDEYVSIEQQVNEERRFMFVRRE